MPNTKPLQTQELLEAKYQIGSTNAWANYSLHGNDDNLEVVLKTVVRWWRQSFMGSSTGNMLVDKGYFRRLFLLRCSSPRIEDEGTIRRNMVKPMNDMESNLLHLDKNGSKPFLSSCGTG
jgi:hypothetical protein